MPDALFQRADTAAAAEGQVGMPCCVIRHETSGADVPLAGDALPLRWLPAQRRLDYLQEEGGKAEAFPRKKKDRTALGLGLYALSSCFLATMLMFAKKLGKLSISILLACQTPRPLL